MSRREILEDTLARLEAERYAPLPARRSTEYRGPPEPLTPEQQEHNRDVLMAALESYPQPPVDRRLAELRREAATRTTPRVSRRRSA